MWVYLDFFPPEYWRRASGGKRRADEPFCPTTLIYVVSQAMPFTPETEAQQIWVNVMEAAEITGYSRDRMRRIMLQIWNLPEEQHNIQIRKRTGGYEIWLPDLFAYLSEFGKGPQRKRKLTP